MRMNVKGIDDVLNSFDEALGVSRQIYSKALYDGAEELANAISKNIDLIPVQQNPDGSPVWGTEKRPLYGITSAQKEDLKGGFGVAKFDERGGVITTSVGFNGYGHDDFPIPFLARTVESGTSFRKKHPFVRPAVNSVKEKVKKRIQERFKKELAERIK